ncbi:hypothetical protein LRS73_18070 [Methylobacterium currus]|uniref:hypothetical protein n=1 Tax=Methylobacterium currus TaxID=2051553 RepID=UPI001E656386|nr:hypothetical protein [Methylobacterium currus]UHC14455.1 hypothetical protein LRS73_18070 [Methylobacterium currus]
MLQRFTREALAAGAERNMSVDLRLELKGIEVRVTGLRRRDQQSYTQIERAEWARLEAADDPAAALMVVVKNCIRQVTYWIENS